MNSNIANKPIPANSGGAPRNGSSAAPRPPRGQERTAHVHIEWTPGWVRSVNIATGETAAGRTLSDLGAALNGHRQVLVAIGRKHVFLKAVRLPKALPDDLRRIISVQLGQLFPLPADQLAFDFIQTSDRTGDGSLTVVAAMRSDDLRELRSELKLANLSAIRVLPVSLAAAAVAARAGTRSAVVVEPGSSGLSLDVVQDGVLRFSRVASVDGDPQTEIQRTLAASGAESLAIIAPPELQLSDSISSSLSSLSLVHEVPPFAFELAEDRVQEVKQRVAARTRLAILLLLSALLLVTLVWVDRSDAQAKINRAQSTNARQLARLRTLRNDETARTQDVISVQNELKSAFNPAQNLSDIVGLVGDSLPVGAWLTAINLERGKLMEVRGTAKTSGDVAKFVNALGASPRFRDVRLVFANSAAIGAIPVVQFNVSAVCVGNIPMPAPPKAAGISVRRTAAASGLIQTRGAQ